MIHDECEKEPLARGVKKCSMIGCDNMTYANYHMCERCSDESNLCTKCGKPVEEPDVEAMADNEIAQAKARLREAFLRVPSEEEVGEIVDCIVKGTLLKTTAIMQEVWNKGGK
jgi:hypothetical protein